MSSEKLPINRLHSINTVLTEVVQYLNANIFQNIFQDCVLIVQKGNRPKGDAIAWFAPTRWEIDGKTYHEITLVADWFGTHSIPKMILIIVHELIHYEGNLLSLPTTNKTGKVHNNNFKRIAEKRGLVFGEKNKKYGWIDEQPDDSLQHVINRCIEDLDLEKNLPKFERINLERKPAKKTMFNFSCPKHGIKIKAKLDTKVLCGLCDSQYEFDDELPS